jgi:type IV pilus assembly protein PilY1
MALDPFTGTNPSDLFFDVNGDGKFDSSDKITYNGKEYPAGGLGFSSIPNNPIFVGNTMLVSFDNGKTSSLNTAGSVGGLNRVSWREIVNQ